jgi:carbamoyl-phosphate synthase large subunit
MVLGSGPNRIGQGIEFDACCCHAVMALRAEGIESILVNCNPETVSTDYDTADRLYFEPLRFEEVMHIVEVEKPDGVILTLGGQTPLKLAHRLQSNGVKLIGTPVEAIDRAEDRDRFGDLCRRLQIHTPENGSARSMDEAITVAERIGYPIMVRPSYVLGGRAMKIVYDRKGLLEYFDVAARVAPEHPVLIDRFLDDAVEFDVDAICDGEAIVIGGMLQHIEEAGIHSGDSFAVLPPYRVTDEERQSMRRITRDVALALGVVGLVNVQFAIHDGTVYVIEVNPRASRTVPFLEKATGLPMVEIATRCMLGQSLHDQQVEEPAQLDRVFVKGPVFPFRRFPLSDRLLGPEMKSTGEVMGIGRAFGEAFSKAHTSTGVRLPDAGRAFISVNDRDKELAIPIARGLAELGFSLLATRGTQHFLRDRGIDCEVVAKVNEGRPDIAEMIHGGQVQLVLNTPLGKKSHYDEEAIRRAATLADVPCITTLSGGRAAVDAIMSQRSSSWAVDALQELHA